MALESVTVDLRGRFLDKNEALHLISMSRRKRVFVLAEPAGQPLAYLTRVGLVANPDSSGRYELLPEIDRCPA